MTRYLPKRREEIVVESSLESLKQLVPWLHFDVENKDSTVTTNLDMETSSVVSGRFDE